MPVNADVEFRVVEEKISKTKDKREKLKLLQQLLALAPSHKGAENLRANIKKRIAKLKEEIEREEKKKRGVSFKIEKQGVQICMYGLTNSGKSLLLSLLTNAKPNISEIPFTTQIPEIGMFKHNDVDFQLIEFPSLHLNLDYDKRWLSFALTTDLILILANSTEDAKNVLEEIFCFNEEIKNKRILVVLNFQQELKEERIEVDDRKIKVVHCDIIKHKEILKDKIYGALDIYRIYLKKPSQKPSEKPLVFLYKPSILDVLEKIKISKEKVIKAIVYGKSVKFDGQNVSLNHGLEDKDIVEFYFKKF
jgi:ribosome-interacting GTPase 1